MAKVQLYSLVASLCEQQNLMDSKKIARSSVGYLSLLFFRSNEYCCLLVDNKDMKSYSYDAGRYLLSMMLEGYNDESFSRGLEQRNKI